MRLVAESGADLVLNAIVGSAGLGPTVVALTEGIDVALANKESLVVGGELVMALSRGHRRAAHPGRLRALRAAPAGRRRAAGHGGDTLRLTASGGPFRGRTRDGAGGGHRRGGAAAPDLGDGRQDHDRLGDADEQGPRGDRGPPPLRDAVRADRRRRAPAVDRPLLVTLCDGATLAHLGHPDMRVPIAYALHHPDRVDVPVRRSTSPRSARSPSSRPTSTRSRACAWPARRPSPAGRRPCVLNAANEVAVHAFLAGRLDFMGIPAVIEATLERLPAAARALVRVALRGRRARPAASRPTVERRGAPRRAGPRARSSSASRC